MYYTFKLNLDDRIYRHIGVSGLKRTAQIMEDGNGGWTLNGEYQRGIIGTLYSYSFTLYQLGPEYAEEYDEVYEILTSPQNTHKLVVPYGQGTIELTVYITDVDDALRWEDERGMMWGAMNVSCMAQAPSRTASGV